MISAGHTCRGNIIFIPKDNSSLFQIKIHMVTSSHGNIFRVNGLLCWKFIGHRWLPHKRPMTRIFDVFFHLLLHKRLSKHPRRRWFGAPSHSLWRRCIEIIICLACLSLPPKGKEYEIFISNRYSKINTKLYLIWNMCHGYVPYIRYDAV